MKEKIYYLIDENGKIIEVIKGNALKLAKVIGNPKNKELPCPNFQ